MGKVALSCKPWIKSVVGFALFGAVFTQTEPAPISDIFFLDLGIVIEPVDEKVTYSRVIKPTSEEVNFRVKKVESGSVYMASSKEMIGALERINRRIELLETSFRKEMKELKIENTELRKSLVALQKNPPKNQKTDSSADLAVDKEIILQPKQKKPEKPIGHNLDVVEVKNTRTPARLFDSSLYMSGVFAYQREDFESALDKFNQLSLDLAPKKTAENIRYWMADAYQQIGDYSSSLSLLKRIEEDGAERTVDAIVQKGLLYRKMGMETKALNAFSSIVNQHPASEYVRLAQMEIKKAEVMP